MISLARRMLARSSGANARANYPQDLGSLELGALYCVTATSAGTRFDSSNPTCELHGSHTLLRHLLFGLSPFDAVTFAAVAGVVALAGLAASCVPVRRAVRLDPVQALRTE